MFILPNGRFGFETIYDLYYDLFNEIGISVNNDGLLYDQDTGNLIAFNGKYIKASINGTPVYPGRNDIVFEPQKNYQMLKCLYGLYIDKCTNSEDGDIIGGYIADFIDDSDDKQKQRVVLRSSEKGDIASDFYFNIYLAYIDNIFRIAGYNVDLSAFDIVETDKK
jgi:hypothetical protein